MMGLLALCGIAAVISVPAHWWLSSFPLAVVVSAVTASLVFQVSVSLQLGYVDKFVSIAFVVGIVVSTLVSTLVGGLTRRWKRKVP
jgi:hypothetical protein